MQRLLRGRLAVALCIGLVLTGVLFYVLYLGELGIYWGAHLPFHSSSSKAKPDSRDLLVRLNPEAHRYRESTAIHLDWTITKGLRFPDGVQKWVYLVNGQFPCPNIEARAGDSIVIDVHNQLEDEGVALHFHGLRMEGANQMDGVVGITQRAMPPGDNFTYTVPISSAQTGTFWWHAHSELMRADGLYGAIVVHSPLSQDLVAAEGPADYEDDSLLLIGDWYHRSATEVQESYDTWANWGLEPAPDSLLVNGRGSFNCSRSSRMTLSECKSLPKPELRPRGRTSRVRIINVGSMSGISVQMPADRIAVLAVDGGNLVQSNEQSFSAVGVLHPGERVDVIVDWTKPSSQEDAQDYLEVVLDREYYKKKNLALVTEQKFPIRLSRSVSRSAPEDKQKDLVGRTCDLAAAHGLAYPPNFFGSNKPDQIILLYTRIELLAHLENSPRGYINHTYWVPQEAPLLTIPRSGWDEHQFVPFVEMLPEKDTWVDIVINNVDEKGHPFHLHGYDFYLVSRFHPDIPFGWHAHNPYEEHKEPAGGPYNLISPLKKDTVYVPAAGYVVLRIKADNPGLWLLHCHVLWHHGVGMAMALEVGKKDLSLSG